MRGNGRPGSALGRVRAAVDELCARRSGLVTFDADGVLWRGDSGNSFLLWQLENHRLRPEGEREARRGWEAYTRGRLGELELAVLCATCLRGLQEAELQADAQAFFEREFRTAIIPEVREWACRLERAGLEVWIVSGSHRWLIEAGARAVGVRQDRILPVATVVRDGVLTPEVLLPVTYGEGKAEAIRHHLGRVPDLAAGNTLADFYMMELASLPVAVEPDAGLEELAQQRNWPVVRFSPHADSGMRNAE